MPWTEALIRFFEEGIPFNRMLGMKVVELGEGRCVLRLATRDELVGNPLRPALHGGVLSALADTAGGLAVFSRLDPDHSVSTVDLRVDYLLPGDIGPELRAVAEVVRLGNRVAVANCDLLQQERVIAQARGVYNVVRGRLMK